LLQIFVADIIYSGMHFLVKRWARILVLSDLDVLVEFEPGNTRGLIRLAGTELELSRLLGGRTVGINTPACLSRFLREQALAEAQTIYVAE